MQYLAACKIRERGFNLIVSDRNPQAVCRQLADVVLEMDTFDVPAHLTACEDIKRKFNIRAVMTSAADCHYTVSRVASHLNLHCLSSSVSEVCRNKAKTRELLAIGGLYQPASHLVQTYSDALAILEKSNTAVVVKASDNSGSRGLSVVPIGGKLTKEQFEYTRAMGTTGGVILEEKLDADTTQISEASVETLWHEGKMYWINWVDRIFPRDLKFFPDITIKSALNEAIEVGHINPARHDYRVKSQVESDIEKAGRAIGMPIEKGGHILKADIFFSTKGPVILELTPRTSGGWDSSASSPARGADIAGGVIHLALGLPVDLDAWYRYFYYHDAERTAVVLTNIPEGAVDCTGRQFAMASGYESAPELIEAATRKIEKGEYIVPVL
jgi:biotin carboxylase